jgi:hypothetical protein
MERYFGYALDVPGTMEIAPYATVTVYQTGTLTLATIYDDNLSTPKGNPFSADEYGYFHFYAAAGRYDVRISDPGVTAPFTWSDIQLQDTYLLARTDVGNSFTGNQSVTGNLTVSGSLTVGGTAIISGGKIPAISSTYFTSLSGANLTALNATQLTTGTLPSARLSGSYTEALTLSSTANVLAGASLALGSTPSTTGAIRLAYNEGIYSKNASSVDTLLLKLGSSNMLELSNATTNSLQPAADDTYNFGTTSLRYRNGHIKNLYSSLIAFGYSLVATSGAVRLGNDSIYAIAFRNAADSADKLFYLNASDQFYLGSTTAVNGNILPYTDDALDLGSASKHWRNLEMSGTATLNVLKVGGGIQLQLAGGTYAELIDVNGSDQLVLGDGTHNIKLAKAPEAASSGAATLGVLPAGATTFGGWLRFINSSGTTIWVPCFQ